MTIREAIKARHSVRRFKDQPIKQETADRMNKVISECSSESGMNIRLILDDPECFDTMLAHYGKFKNAVNYIALVGNKNRTDLDETAGYYGQKIVLEAQMAGLNTCWTAGSFSRGKCKATIATDEKIVCVIAIGYGENEGVPHKSKPLAKLCTVKKDDMPVWFKNGMLAAALAPTAVNQQRFVIGIDGDEAVITEKKGFLTAIDLGIVRYNFEAASGHRCRRAT